MGDPVAEPLYRMIAEDLRRKIESGELPKERRGPLPTEGELQKEFGASRNTIREAIKWLITLDLVENVHILDETWVPDDQEQLADRAVNTSRMHQIGVYVYRSKNTIEQQIAELNIEKGKINRDILDHRRRGFRANIVKSQKNGKS